MTPDDVRLAAEQRARVLIEQQLRAAGWLVQDPGTFRRALFAATFSGPFAGGASDMALAEELIAP